MKPRTTKPKAKDVGYTFVRYLGTGQAVFQEQVLWGNFEVWASNPGHASFGFSYNNTDWEFVCDFEDEQKRSLKREGIYNVA